MVIGTIIGASIFVQPSLVSGAVPSVSGMLLVWAVAGVLTLIGALVTAELASAFPGATGISARGAGVDPGPCTFSCCSPNRYAQRP